MYTGYEIYSPKNEYFTKDGQIYTEEMFSRDYPAVHSEKIVVYLYGGTVTKAYTMSYLRGINRIKNDVTDEEAIIEFNRIKQLDDTESTAIERIAASLEYLILLFMEDMQ